MVLTRVTIALLTVAFAVNISSSGATASDGGLSSTESKGAVSMRDLWLHGMDELFSSGSNPLGQSLSGFLNLAPPVDEIPSLAASSLSLFILNDGSERCRVAIQAGSGVAVEQLQLTLNPTERTVAATFQEEAVEEQHESGLGDRHSSRTVKSTSIILLPKHCIANPAMLSAHMGGYIIEQEYIAYRGYRGLVVLPSVPLLLDYVDQGLLPPGIVDSVTEGDKEQLDQLNPKQLCLAAGFTSDECPVIGNKKPEVEKVGPRDDAGGIPIPRYGISLRLLD